MLEIELFCDVNCVFMLNRIVWNRTVFDIETMCKQKSYLYSTTLFELELFDKTE